MKSSPGPHEIEWCAMFANFYAFEVGAAPYRALEVADSVYEVLGHLRPSTAIKLLVQLANTWQTDSANGAPFDVAWGDAAVLEAIARSQDGEAMH